MLCMCVCVRVLSLWEGWQWHSNCSTMASQSNFISFFFLHTHSPHTHHEEGAIYAETKEKIAHRTRTSPTACHNPEAPTLAPKKKGDDKEATLHYVYMSYVREESGEMGGMSADVRGVDGFDGTQIRETM